MTGQFEFVHSIRVPGLLHTRVRRQASANGRYPRAYGPSSVQHIPGVLKVVVQKNSFGVVARTQYEAMLVVRQLAVQWNSGPELAPQKSFLEHLQNGFRMQC
jgi:nicotinate dehydrogenase subunit B